MNKWFLNGDIADFKEKLYSVEVFYTITDPCFILGDGWEYDTTFIFTTGEYSFRICDFNKTIKENINSFDCKDEKELADLVKINYGV